jgi:hypothetical protein
MIHSYYMNNQRIPCGKLFDYKGIAEFIRENNISEFLTDIPIYDGLKEYGFSIDSKNTPEKNEYFNYIIMRKS